MNRRRSNGRLADWESAQLGHDRTAIGVRPAEAASQWPGRAAIEDQPGLERQAAIQQLKRERRAVILAHNYMTPDIYHGVADFRGDSLALARQAMASDAEVIVVAGVLFMAETAKLLNPDRMVLTPDRRAGCYLADAITPEDIAALRARHPGVPVVCYVNTTAAVKAACDVCCTSANAIAVVQALGVERVIMVPDRNLASYVAQQCDVEVIPWPGTCQVHDRFRPAELAALRRADPQVRVVAHPECRPEVLATADFVGSTAAMADYVARERPRSAILATERSMTDNLALEYPEVGFIRPQYVCHHMKRITLAKIEHSLRYLESPVEIDPAVSQGARRALERMLELSPGREPPSQSHRSDVAALPQTLTAR